MLEIVCLSQDLFLVLSFLPIMFLGRSLQLLFLVGPFLTQLSTCFDTAFYNVLVDVLIAFFILRAFWFCFITKKSFSRNEYLKDLVLFMRIEFFNVCIKTVL